MTGIELAGHVGDAQIGRQPLLIMTPKVGPGQLV
ncbi:Uncharacterised protein [Serratia ficaria]|nr:Uncharacterised protein [Serratia ficaria]